VRPSWKTDDYTLLGRFVRETPRRSTKYTQVFYDRLDEMSRTWADIRAMRTQGELQKAQELQQDNRGKLAYRALFNRMSKRLGVIRKQIALVQRGDMDASTKRKRIDQLQNRLNILTKRTVQNSSTAF